MVNGVPQTLNLRQLLLLFLRHRENIVRRATIFDLKAAHLRSHILKGLKIALDHLDAVIATIRSSATADDAKTNLMAKFDLTDLQANAILEMQLRRLAALERQKIEDEYTAVGQNIDSLTAILTQTDKMLAVLKKENQEIMEKYGDNRLTKIYVKDLQSFSYEDLIPNEATIVTLTQSGYIKRVSKDTYRSQKRGGLGISGMATKAEDEIERILSVNTHDNLLFFTNRGRVFKIKVWDIPESTRHSKGQALINLINITQGETIQATLPMTKNHPGESIVNFILLATKNGLVKKTSIDRFKNIRQTGLTAIRLDAGDKLAWAKSSSGQDQVFLVTVQGKCIRFAETDVRPMGRHTRGVRGILLKPNDCLVSMDILPSVSDKKGFRHLLVATQNGVGKRNDVYLYPLQKRGGVGVKVANLSKNTSQITAAQVVTQTHDQVFLVSKKGVTIKLPLKNIPVLKNRNTRGVILMRFKSDDDALATLTALETLEQGSAPQK